MKLFQETGVHVYDAHQINTNSSKVHLMEDEENCIHLKNLPIYAATNEEEALNLLSLGDTNHDCQSKLQLLVTLCVHFISLIIVFDTCVNHCRR